MAEKLRLTVACGDYEIVRAIKEGTVKADGLDLVMLTGMGPRERHWRMARHAEFDICEGNVGAYFMERDHGVPLTALAVRVPPRVAPPGLLTRATVTPPLKLGSTLPNASRADTARPKPEPAANGLLLRGFDTHRELPSFRERTG